MSIVYFLEEKPYINITNLCTNSCKFCVRDIKDDVKGQDMHIKEESIKAQDAIDELENLKGKLKGEIVFCGYGEPLIKIEEVKKIAKYIKENFKDLKIRVNTNGQANLIHKRNVVDELVGLVDCVSISLNAQNEELYNEISKPQLKGAYTALLVFAKLCKNAGIETVMSVVTGFEDFTPDVEECKKITQKLGVNFRQRHWVKGY